MALLPQPRVDARVMEVVQAGQRAHHLDHVPGELSKHEPFIARALCSRSNAAYSNALSNAASNPHALCSRPKHGCMLSSAHRSICKVV